MKSKSFRGAMIVVTNLVLGFALLKIHEVQTLFLPFAIIAIGLLSLSLGALNKPYVLIKAPLFSFFIAILVPMVGLWLDKTNQSSFESFFVVGLLGVGFGWKECLFMFALNTTFFIWYSNSKS